MEPLDDPAWRPAHEALLADFDALVDTVRERPETLRALDSRTAAEGLAEAERLDADFSGRLAAFRDQHGHAFLFRDAAERPLGEDAAALGALLRLATKSATDWRRDDAAGPTPRPFSAAAAAALTLLLDCELEAVDAPLALVRRLALALGERLAAAEQIDTPSDVFFLTLDEARTALRDGGAQQDAISVRRAAWETASAARPQQMAGQLAVIPLELYPPVAVVSARALLVGLRLRGGPRLGAQLAMGEQACNGSATGPVTVVRSAKDLGSLSAGAVLAFDAATPAWGPLIGAAGAVISEVGGPLSTGAALAWLCRTPAVVGFDTTRLRDGQLAQVDGDMGAVTSL